MNTYQNQIFIMREEIEVQQQDIAKTPADLNSMCIDNELVKIVGKNLRIFFCRPERIKTISISQVLYYISLYD